MGAFWGAVTEVNDLGVVAEQCPHCEQLTACLLRSICRGDYIFFVKMSAPVRESSSLCTGCLKAFPCEQSWRYAAVLPIGEAKALPIEELLARTNPVLAERLQFKEQVCALGGDPRFTTAYEHLEAMRPGALRSELMKQLLDWDRLTEDPRTALVRQIGERARAWQFARQVAGGFPAPAGCLTFAAAVLVVGPAFLFVPALRDWLWGTITVVGALVAAAFLNHTLLTRWVKQWTRKVLIPEAEEANVPLECFLAVIDDVPGSRLGLMEDLWPLKDQLETIRAVLVAEGRLKVTR